MKRLKKDGEREPVDDRDGSPIGSVAIFKEVVVHPDIFQAFHDCEGCTRYDGLHRSSRWFLRFYCWNVVYRRGYRWRQRLRLYETDTGRRKAI